MKSEKDKVLVRIGLVCGSTTDEQYIRTHQYFNPCFWLFPKNSLPPFADLHLKITVQTHHWEKRFESCRIIAGNEKREVLVNET